MYLTYRPTGIYGGDPPQRKIATDDALQARVVYLRSADTHSRLEADVERINSFSFYDIGKSFKTIEALEDDIAPMTVFWALHQSKATLNTLLGGKPIPLGISRAKATEFLAQVESLYNENFSGVNDEGKAIIKWPDANTPKIKSWEVYWVKKALSEFETIFAEEMKETATYYVPRRGIFWTPALVDTADEAFPESLRGHVPQKTKDDWKAAGRCLAFNLLSASGFHAARAVEGTLEAYYQLFSGKAGETLNNWHDYKGALDKIAEKKPTPCPNAKTLAELDQMRTDYRNPIMHPRVVLTEPDARMLFANGESLIIAMAQEICDVRLHGGVQLALTQDATKTIAGQGARSSAIAPPKNASDSAKAG
jgi:hypothetical protein